MELALRLPWTEAGCLHLYTDPSRGEMVSFRYGGRQEDIFEKIKITMLSDAEQKPQTVEQQAARTAWKNRNPDDVTRCMLQNVSRSTRRRGQPSDAPRPQINAKFGEDFAAEI